MVYNAFKYSKNKVMRRDDMCRAFYYVKCKCGKIFYEGNEEMTCGSSGFESEDDGSKCFQCEEREYYYLLDDKNLIKCIVCGKKIKLDEKLNFQQVSREDIVKLNGGIIVPSNQTLGLLQPNFGRK